ncbi:MAG: CPBP family intramembrane metalloprotease [Chloroflexota bacterium]|nr:CPBP family intramembrane metalloprotease [Chloroflexota bacterium]
MARPRGLSGVDRGGQADAGRVQGPLPRVALFLAAFFLAWTIRATVLFPLDERIAAGWPRQVYANAVKFALWVVPVVLYLRYVDGTNLFGYLRLTTPPRWAGLVRAAVVAVLFFALAFAGPVATRGVGAFSIDPGRAAAILASVAVSPVWEEVLFRGFIFGKLREQTRFWTANLATAVLFVAVHWPHWLWSDGPRADLLATSAGVLALALVLGYLVEQTNSLWLAVVVHIANNFLVALLRG